MIARRGHAMANLVFLSHRESVTALVIRSVATGKVGQLRRSKTGHRLPKSPCGFLSFAETLRRGRR
jgi:hypothetical protein